ncbi:MAG: S41 family peptidase [Lentisphaeria bacterium]|nr:S41 family peptidase [Lentisphaeria bacterium]
MRTKILLLLSGIAAALLAGCTTADTPPPQEGAGEKDYLNAGVLVQAMDILNRKYVDAEKTGNDNLFEAALHGMVSNLDPYSDYEPPRAFDRNQKRRTGELSGIGVTIVKPHRNPLHVVNVIPGSPAEKAGIKPGDTILAVDGKDLRKLNFYQCQQLLTGRPGSKVTVTWNAAGKIRKQTIARKHLVTPTVSAAKLAIPGIGYIRIDSFTSHTPDEFLRARKKLAGEGAKALVIDLRNNTGGLVRSAVLTLSQLLAPGTILFTATQRDTAKVETIRSMKLKNLPPDTTTPLVLLVNSFTASSGEIFTAALVDNKRAQTVGMRTFGKGTLLSVVRLANGGALRFASGRYRTPSGKVIEGRGIRPDHAVVTTLQTLHKLTLQMRRYPGEVRPNAKDAVTDTQLEKALSLLAPPAEKPHDVTEKH